ncbi:MAG: DNA mismatch repair protein MutS [Candidatus Binataceae bacterium]
MIAQYLEVKRRVAGAILFFRLGDFYEMFFEDAEVGSRVLDIQLTSRSKDGVPLCGVPYHAADPYIAKLLKAGHKVAICEQSAPDAAAGSSGRNGAFQLTSPGKGLMPRHIVRIMTPGTVGEETVLIAGEKNFLLAIVPEHAAGAVTALSPSGGAPPDGHATPSVITGYALAAIDISTGEFIVTRLAGLASLREETARLAPREIIAPASAETLSALAAELRCTCSLLDSDSFSAEHAHATLQRYFNDAPVLDGDGAIAAGAALRYVEENFGRDLAHLRPPRLYQATEYMLVDEVSRRHLELVTSSDGSRTGSLLAVLDETLTPIGARTLANWIVYPLLDLKAIGERHDAVEELFESDLGGAMADALRRIGDLERMAGRIGSLRASPRDLLKLGQALAATATLREVIANCRSPLLQALAALLHPMPAIVAQIDAAISDEPPMNPRDGNTIRAGFNPDIDELRSLALDARGVITRLEASERERSRIPSLKVRYNQVFGYYIEVTKTHLERVPDDYERKQTLVGAERFTTPALKELERKILSAEAGLRDLELQLFSKLLRDLADDVPAMLETARAVGQFDALRSLASAARRRGYVRPLMNSGTALKLRDGRHPVLEIGMKPGEFVPNDLDADPADRQLLLITGPNMAGKSTYLRQIALIVIMAQMGSFVPATEAELGLTDRVFTRIGARDELRRGDSTFMVEMRETARLLDGLTDRSLLLLDEVGRGTSTFDGLAIAWAIAEYLTHFHELTELAREHPRVRNLGVTVREWNGSVLFLRRVMEGAVNRSFGIEVARLAGLPQSIIDRAGEILRNLEQGRETGMARVAPSPEDAHAAQIGLFESAETRVLEELRTLDADRMTPMDALATLARLTSRLRSSD